MSPLPKIPILPVFPTLATLTLLIPTAYASTTYTNLYPQTGIQVSREIPSSFLTSRAVKIVNPRGLRCVRDSRLIEGPMWRISALEREGDTAEKERGSTAEDDSGGIDGGREGGSHSGSGARGQGIGDEEILSRFTRGFFGGWVFTPERIVLRGLRILGRRALGLPVNDSYQARQIWSLNDVSREKLPDVNDVFFGAFQVVDKHIHKPEFVSRSSALSFKVSGLGSENSGESYIDFGYGSQSDSLTGVHRFSVTRVPKTPAQSGKQDSSQDVQGEERVFITFSCIALIPNDETKTMPDYLSRIHLIYAMILFRERLAELMR